MSLIKCPECTKEISDQAPTCPFCGFPISQNSKSFRENPQNFNSKQDVNISLQKIDNEFVIAKKNFIILFASMMPVIGLLFASLMALFGDIYFGSYIFWLNAFFFGGFFGLCMIIIYSKTYTLPSIIPLSKLNKLLTSSAGLLGFSKSYKTMINLYEQAKKLRN